MKTWIKRIGMLVVAGGVIAAAAAWQLRPANGQAASFETAKVTRGDLLVTIAASGTLEPEEVVDIGAQISGRIVSFGKDAAGNPVDYGSAVTKDLVVAKIDDALYQADLEEAKAQVASAEAGVKRAEADLKQYEAKSFCAQRDWQRAEQLKRTAADAISQTEYDSYEAAHKTAAANVEVGKAAIRQAEASLAQAQNSRSRAQRNLDYCTITSPINGTVIDRRVSIGQTVASGLNTPSLFLIARDLRKMQVWVSVNEADIARVHPGQPVTFTVDALPDETFRGQVYRIRPNAAMTQNVVTFTVEISTDNTAGRLRPYLTANVRFEVVRRDNVLMVPAAALSFIPSVDQVAPEFRQGPLPGDAPSTQPASGKSASPGLLYVAQGRYVRPMPVMVGVTDGASTEVTGAELRADAEIVTGVQTGPAGAPQGDLTNPFTPKAPKNMKPPSGGGGPPPL